MAKKKTISRDFIVEKYMDYVLEHNEDPKSVYKFSKDNNFEEQLFYKEFASFEALKESVFTSFIENTLTLLHKSDHFDNYDARNQLLSFYFTFFEILTANRSYVVYALADHKKNLQSLKQLKGLRTHFKAFIDNLDINRLDLKQEKLEKLQDKAISESAWAQLLVSIKFWLGDTSSSFEKTDLFIEKSINTGFDLINTEYIKSVIDLGKFLFKEKLSMS